MKTEKIPVSKLKTGNKSPRIIKDAKFAQLIKSLREFPEMLSIRPIVIDENNNVLGGKYRLKALIELKIPEAEVIRATNLSEKQKQEFTIKDNLHSGEWDWNVIAIEWDTDQLTDWGLDIPDFACQDKTVDDGFIMPKVVKTDIKRGDMFEIGKHRLLCGDSTQLETYTKLMGNDRSDLVVTDPPYNVNYEGGTADALKIANDNMDNESFYKFLHSFYSSLNAYTKPGGVWYVWHADSEGANFRLAMKNAGILVKQCLIWVKNSMVLGRQDYQWKHEPCLYGWKEGAAHPWYTDRKQTTVLEFDKPSRNAEHPTMKPIPLIGYQICNSSKKNAIVADGFGGSGTTMVASEQLGRKCRMVEFDPRYCQVIIDRMKALNPKIKISKVA